MIDQDQLEKVKRTFPEEQQFVMCNELVQMWINYTHEHPELMLGTQLRAFSVCAALAMRICDLEESELPEAIEQMDQLIRQVYKNAEDKIAAATLQ